jgi:hypothetical protein
MQAISHGKFELMSRSIDAGPEQTEESKEEEKQKLKNLLPYQRRRLRSASPPLQICNENYIMYS